MDTTQAIILSIVEGLTEFLPISSTGHLVLAAEVLGIPQTEFVKSFEIFIQLGAILAVVFLYHKKLLTAGLKFWRNILLAFIPTAVLGLIFYKIIKDLLLGNIYVTLSALLMGGIVLIFLNKLLPYKNNLELEDLSLKQALYIGFFQAISMIPGVSRAAATIIGGISQGLNKKAAVEFSFLLAIPTMLAATSLDLIRSNYSFSVFEYQTLAVGFIGSFFTALLAIKFFINFIAIHDFKLFGVYRILLAIIFFLFMR